MSKHKDTRENLTALGVEMTEAQHEHVLLGFASTGLSKGSRIYYTEKCPACYPNSYARHYSRHNSLKYDE
jgi:hypothetical protein